MLLNIRKCDSIIKKLQASVLKYCLHRNWHPCRDWKQITSSTFLLKRHIGSLVGSSKARTFDNLLNLSRCLMHYRQMFTMSNECSCICFTISLMQCQLIQFRSHRLWGAWRLEQVWWTCKHVVVFISVCLPKYKNKK